LAKATKRIGRRFLSEQARELDQRGDGRRRCRRAGRARHGVVVRADDDERSCRGGNLDVADVRPPLSKVWHGARPWAASAASM
jgi:hypothetical protein